MKEQTSQLFIFTQDENVVNYLTSNGFTLLSNNNRQFMFMNNGVLKFDKDEDKNILTKMTYTNKMLF